MRWRRHSKERGPMGPNVRPRMSTRRCVKRCERLDELELPMLMVVGELDLPGIHEIADKVVAANPNAELVVVPDVAHMVNMEAPEEFNELLLRFLEQF